MLLSAGTSGSVDSWNKQEDDLEVIKPDRGLAECNEKIEESVLNNTCTGNDR